MRKNSYLVKCQIKQATYMIPVSVVVLDKDTAEGKMEKIREAVFLVKSKELKLEKDDKVFIASVDLIDTYKIM